MAQTRTPHLFRESFVRVTALAGVILVAGARDTAAIQIKLDELIRAVEDTDERLIGIEDRSAEELELLRQNKTPSPPA